MLKPHLLFGARFRIDSLWSLCSLVRLLCQTGHSDSSGERITVLKKCNISIQAPESFKIAQQDSLCLHFGFVLYAITNQRAHFGVLDVLDNFFTTISLIVISSRRQFSGLSKLTSGLLWYSRDRMPSSIAKYDAADASNSVNSRNKWRNLPSYAPSTSTST